MPNPDLVIPHRHWQHAYDSLLTMLTQGPACQFLLGPPGTGKTLLLRELARSLRRRGRQVHLLLSGDLPVDASDQPDAVLLIDEASRMNSAVLARLAGQPPCPLVLAGLPGLNASIHGATFELLPLSPPARQFTIDWLVQANRNPRLTIPAIERLLIHAAGVPRVMVQLLKAALFLAGDTTTPITPASIDEVAAFRGDPPPAETADPPP